MQLGFWENKKVLLTGHTGFKGTWMTMLLKELGAQVAGFSLPLEEASFYRKVKANVDYHFEGDIRSKIDIGKVFGQFEPEVLFHFASHSSLHKSDKIPDYILGTNIMGLVHLLEEVRLHSSVKAAVIVTSDKCYKDTDKPGGYDESCQLWADNPYSVSKVCQEIISECYRKTFFENPGRINLATARASNVIAYGDYNLTRLIPYAVDCYLRGSKAVIRNPHAIRPWQYVLDVLWGYLLLAQKLYCNYGLSAQYNGAYNFGPTANTFAEVCEIMVIISGLFGTMNHCYDGQPAKETKILKLDSTKARRELEWKPLYSLERMVRETVQIARQGMEGLDVGHICRSIVRDYLTEVNS